MMENYSLSDIKAVTGEDGAFGGGGAYWIIILFLFLFGMGGNGWGGNNANANGALTRAEMQQGFDNQTIFNKLNGLENGLCDGFYAQNTTMLNGFAGVTQAVDNARFAQQQCCCETQRAIDSVKYEAAQNTAAIMQNDCQNTQKILDAITGNRMADMQNQINQLQLQSAMAGVVRYPTNFSYNAGPSPFCGGCGCNNI